MTLPEAWEEVSATGRLRILLILLILLLFSVAQGVGTAGAQSVTVEAKGVYPNLGTDPSQAAGAVLERPDVDGASAAWTWKSLEPAEGTYRFTLIVAYLKEAAAKHKRFTIRIQTNGEAAPGWLAAKSGVVRVGQGEEKGEIYAPWNPTYNTNVRKMLQAFAAQVVQPNLGSIAYLVVDPFQKSGSNEMATPTNASIAEWRAKGWTEQVHIDQLKSNIDFQAVTFPPQVKIALTYRHLNLNQASDPVVAARAGFTYARSFGRRFMPRATFGDRGALANPPEHFSAEGGADPHVKLVALMRSFGDLGWAVQFGTRSRENSPAWWTEAFTNVVNGGTGARWTTGTGATHLEPPLKAVLNGLLNSPLASLRGRLLQNGPP